MTNKRFDESGYQRKLRDPRWQQKRLKLFEAAKWECKGANCIKTLEAAFMGGEPPTLTIHHLYYERDREPWDYPDNAFMVLCEDCHEKRQSVERELKKMVVTRMRYVPTEFLLEVLDEALTDREITKENSDAHRYDNLTPGGAQ